MYNDPIFYLLIFTVQIFSLMVPDAASRLLTVKLSEILKRTWFVQRIGKPQSVDECLMSMSHVSPTLDPFKEASAGADTSGRDCRTAS